MPATKKKTTSKKKAAPAPPVQDPILARATELFSSESVDRDKAFNELAELIVPVQSLVLREDYISQISKACSISATVFKSLIKQKEEHAARADAAQKEAESKKAQSLEEYIAINTMPGPLWKAQKLLAHTQNPVERNTAIADLARTLALMPRDHAVMRDDYVKEICKTYDIRKQTLEDYMAKHAVVEEKKASINRTIRKNTVAKLNGEPKTFPFFVEQVTENKKTNEKTFKGIKIDKLKFVQLLASFGFTRYATENDTTKEGFTFVRLQDNVISEVSPEEIIDFIEHFIQKEYDFDGAGCEYVDSDMLINTFYDGIDKYFNKKLFARVRNENPILINRDTATECFLYYKNGFVKITKDDYELLKYDKMDGSVWSKQMLSRNFEKVKMPMIGVEVEGGEIEVDWEETFSTDRPLGLYADFIWRLCGQKQQRFISLCTIIGYMVHDYYDYVLKFPFITDSTVSDKSEGRTGKSLCLQMLRYVRSYCEIDGKNFNQQDERKYQTADRSTQLMHINDLSHKGKFKFSLEAMFNEIVAGILVRQMFKSPFLQRLKIAGTSNKSMITEGPSDRDRIIEFEVSNFFGEHRRPVDYYGKWFGTGWDDNDFKKFDNFICFCVQTFFSRGLVPPDTINLGARKLLDGTKPEFLQFMNSIKDAMKNGTPWEGYKSSGDLDFNKVESIYDFEFDKKQLFERFVTLYPDFNDKHERLSQRRFTDWLRKYGSLALNCPEPIERHSNGIFYIKYTKPQPAAPKENE